jgi:putative tryptophan/tyrosine transport system substrate-binding protein
MAAVFMAAGSLFCCCAGTVSAAPFSVTIVLSENSGAYLEFSNALRENLLRKNITPVVTGNPAAPVADSDLVIGVGMKAATAIPKSAHEKLLRDFPWRAKSKTYSAIFLDQSPARQIGLIAAALPDKQRVGILYATPPVDLLRLKQATKERGLVLHEQMVGPNIALHEALQIMLNESQVLLALPDTEIYNGSTIRNILLAAYRSGIPLVGFSAGYVKAGALCALYSTPEQLAAQAAVLINNFSETKNFPPAQYPREFEVAVNDQVARSLGLRTRSAAELHNAIQVLERNEP